MSGHEDAAARATLRIAGVFQGKRDLWVRRLESYYTELEKLIVGEWLDSSDLSGLVREARLASREAIDGLANDLSAELLHTSSGIFSRFETDRASLIAEISKLQAELSRLISSDEEGVLRENDALRSVVLNLPEYQLLCIIQQSRGGTYADLSARSSIKKGKVQKYIKMLAERGHVIIDRKSRPHRVLFVDTPWNPNPTGSISDYHPEVQQALHPQV
jgi:DNA-binding MarR family transcriptional regulator